MYIYIYPLYIHVVKTLCAQFDCLNPPITVSGDHHLRWRSALKFCRSSRDAKNALLSACSAGCDGTGPIKNRGSPSIKNLDVNELENGLSDRWRAPTIGGLSNSQGEATQAAERRR